KILLADELLPDCHIPQTELRFQSAVALAREPSRDELLRANSAPIRPARSNIDIRDFFDIRLLVDRIEQGRALEIGRDDLGNVARRLSIRWRAADKIRQRNRSRLEFTRWNCNTRRLCLRVRPLRPARAKPRHR